MQSRKIRTQAAALLVGVTTLSDLIGYKILCEPEWRMLWTELQPHFSDMSTFIRSVCSTVTAWCNTLVALLDDNTNFEWTKQSVQSTSLANRPTFTEDSWADIKVDHASGRIEAREEKPTMSVSGFSSTPLTRDSLDILPDVSSLERPEYLMLKPPYHLIISHSAHQKEMVVQCSHPPTLKVIERYLKQWTKRDNNTVNRPLAVIITLQKSPFGLRIVFDRLHISMQNARMHYLLGPTMLLSFVEGVLGYKLTFGNGDMWTFRKKTEFRGGDVWRWRNACVYE
ncbi:hypothetical protein K432DRAFT_413867 [Lepidopterella palustris CBS 459.81]|uniref:Uncharacterized protein n=1 Tax=Lepidopterella palustris CBS 459.81 TaxID=1314670 RepID=A0A8E2EII3_9PEZI|nr:hypothetical protein K432DRAFT_413867 [Lepidopterella palustris CBS 459.81]